ncbi:hypothetical protein ACYJ2M_39270, partial [Streptomyces sp. DT9]
VDGNHVTVTPSSWDKERAPGMSVTIGFVTSSDGTTAGSGADGKAADPTGCVVDGAMCSVDTGATPQPSGRPTGTATPTATQAQ